LGLPGTTLPKQSGGMFANASSPHKFVAHLLTLFRAGTGVPYPADNFAGQQGASTLFLKTE